MAVEARGPCGCVPVTMTLRRCREGIPPLTSRPLGVLERPRLHGYPAFLGVDPTAALVVTVHGGLLIALRADLFAVEEVRDVVEIVPGKATALDVVTADGTLTIVNVHGTGSGGDS